MDRASATETVDTGSIPGRFKPKTIKIRIHSFLLDVQQLKGQYEASIVCGRQMGRWQLDSKIERSLRCLLAEATWWIKCNYNFNYKITITITNVYFVYVCAAKNIVF